MIDNLIQLEIDVKLESDRRNMEVLFRLIDRLDVGTAQPALSLTEAHRKYVELKLYRHRLKKYINNSDLYYHGSGLDQDRLERNIYEQFNNLTVKIKKAREIYYDAKRRIEDERNHHHSC